MEITKNTRQMLVTVIFTLVFNFITRTQTYTKRVKFFKKVGPMKKFDPLKFFLHQLGKNSLPTLLRITLFHLFAREMCRKLLWVCMKNLEKLFTTVEQFFNADNFEKRFHLQR